jgi:hypothetical protein
MSTTMISNLKPETRDVLEMMYAVRLIYKINDPDQVFKMIHESILDGTFPEKSSKSNFEFVKQHPAETQLVKRIYQNYSTNQFYQISY